MHRFLQENKVALMTVARKSIFHLPVIIYRVYLKSMPEMKGVILWVTLGSKGHGASGIQDKEL